MKTSETITAIAPALLKAQKLIGAATKGSENPFFHSKYADLGEVIEVCKEHLNANGITVLQPVGNGDGGTYVETILLHESGEYISSTMKVALKDPDNPQAQGSAITYARRYSLQSMVLIPAEDDDGEAATGNHEDKGVFPATTPTVDPTLGLGPEHKKLWELLKKASEEWNQPAGDILYKLTTFEAPDKKDPTKKVIIKGKYVLKECSPQRAETAYRKLEKLLGKELPPGFDDDDVPW